MSDTQMLLVAGYADVDLAEGACTGTVRNVVFDLAPHAHDVEVDLHEAMSQAALAHGAAG